MKILKIQELLDFNKKKIDLIRSSTDGDYDRDYYPAIQSMAEWFNSLPLNTEIYDEPGGAFRCCVESAYFVMRQAKATIFTSDMTSDKRRQFEPQYQYAAFLSAILSWVDEPFRHFDIKNQNTIFNPSIERGMTEFISGNSILSVSKREFGLAPSRQRTMMFATRLVMPFLDRLHENVQDALYSSINPDRRPQNAESVLQRVVRKGLSQAEELERKTKNLILNSVERDVVSSQMMKSTALDNFEESASADNSEQTSVEPSNASSSEKEIKPQRNQSTKTEEKQISLPIEEVGLPDNFPRQYKELLGALSLDIQSGRKKTEETEWMSSGLLIPKNFFANYGKSVQQCIEDLRKHGVVLGEVNKNVLISKTVGLMLVPKGSKNV